jgi:hypothetical protein
VGWLQKENRIHMATLATSALVSEPAFFSTISWFKFAGVHQHSSAECLFSGVVFLGTLRGAPPPLEPAA